MDIITSHNAVDFDGLASMVAASKLYPSAQMVFSGTLSRNVQKFMALYKDSLMIKNPREINLEEIERIIVVDTANANRLGQLKSLTGNKDIDYHIYDHHPVAEGDLNGSLKVVQKVGAAATILVEKIIAQGLEISSFDATILALGIYEDTGSMLFSSTTPRDVRTVAFLLERGANLAVVSNFMEMPFSSKQREILQLLLHSAEHFRINNEDIVVACYEDEKFTKGLDVVTFRLFEVENADAVFVLALMEGKINVIARSRTSAVKVNEVLTCLGGRGHEKAAAAVVKGKTLPEVKEEILQYLQKNVAAPLVARDIMSTPVKTIPMTFSMEEAGRLMLRYGHTGLPVVEDDSMVGIISRRDVDKARIHKLGHAPVKGFMTSEVLTVFPDTPVAEIQRLMVDHDIGRLPVVEGQRLIGIVSRTDILRTLHGDDYPEDYALLYTNDDTRILNCSADIMLKNLPEDIITILRTAGDVAEETGNIVYCVGGFVRDLYLQVPNFDVDLVVEGDGTALAVALAERLGGRARVHHRFRTAVVILPDKTKIDVATARTEYYEFPAALPKVEKSSIREDLYRRDFTVNTLAICLNPARFGELIDYFGGLKDLEKGYIRILYNLSFIEDPTRILRAIRFEKRYNFTIEPDTLRFAKDAIQRRMLDKLSYKRVFQEVILILNEHNPIPFLERMVEIGVWDYIMPEVILTELDHVIFKRVRVVLAWFKERYYQDDIRSWLVYMMVLLSKLDEIKIDQVLNRYHMDRNAREAVQESLQVPRILQELQDTKKLRLSYIDSQIANWHRESIIYLLLAIDEEGIWEKVVEYLDKKEYIKIEINGYDLKEMGLKPGPVYKEIINKLYMLKLDGEIKNRQDELNLVEKWMEE